MTWASTSSTSTCPSPSRSPMAAADREQGRSRFPSRVEPFIPGPRWCGVGEGGVFFDLDYERPKSIGRLRASRAISGSSSVPTPTSSVTGRRRACRGFRAGGPERELFEEAPVGRSGRQISARRLRPALHVRVRPFRRADEEGTGDQDPRPGQAAARLRLPSADRLLPAAGRRGF